MAASNTFMIVHGLAPCQAMLDRILALHSRLSSCLLGMAAPSLPLRGENFGWFGGMGGQDGGRVREENEERQNRGCVGEIGAWGQIVTGRRSRKGKGDKKGGRDRETERDTQRGGELPVGTCSQVPSITRAPHVSLHQPVQCPVSCPGPQASGGEDSFCPAVPGERFNAEEDMCEQ